MQIFAHNLQGPLSRSVMDLIEFWQIRWIHTFASIKGSRPAELITQRSSGVVLISAALKGYNKIFHMNETPFFLDGENVTSSDRHITLRWEGCPHHVPPPLCLWKVGVQTAWLNEPSDFHLSSESPTNEVILLFDISTRRSLLAALSAAGRSKFHVRMSFLLFHLYKIWSWVEKKAPSRNTKHQTATSTKTDSLEQTHVYINRARL